MAGTRLNFLRSSWLIPNPDLPDTNQSAGTGRPTDVPQKSRASSTLQTSASFGFSHNVLETAVLFLPDTNPAASTDDRG